MITSIKMEYVYEFSFTDSFSQTIYDQCAIAVTDNAGRQAAIQDTCLQIQNVVKNMKGLHIFSSFCDWESQKYKVTIKNSTF